MNRLSYTAAKRSNFKKKGSKRKVYFPDFKKSDQRLLKKVEKLSRLIVTLHKANADIASIYFDHFKHVLKHHGRKGLVIKMKGYKLQIAQYVLSQPITPLSFTKSGKNGMCLFLKRVVRLLKEDNIYHQRCLVSLGRIPELVTLEPSFDYTTITDGLEPCQQEYIDSILPEFKKFLRGWKPLQDLPNLGQTEYPLKNASGPNTSKVLPYGASIQFFYDLAAVKDEEFFTDIQSMLALQGVDISMYTPKEGEYSHSKIVSLRDKFGKERIIAIGDVVTNWALKPLEIAFQKGLSRMSCSVAYKQSIVPNLIKDLGPHLYSADLSAFTDRFPRQLQKEVVSARYGLTVSNHWENLLTKRTFKSHIGETAYKVGNPMGFLSSWSVSTMTHHAFLEYIAQKNGIRFIYKKYIMLGDDVVVADKHLYMKYIEGIQKLGLRISMPKCTQSESGNTEFAKRLFTPKGEVTGIPVALTLRGLRDPIQHVGLLQVLAQRGYDFNDPTWDHMLLRRQSNKLTQKSMQWASTLPLNHFFLPNNVWLEECDPCMTLDEFLIRQQVVTASEVQKLQDSIKEVHSLVSPDGRPLIPENHPILTNIGNKVNQIFMMNPDGFEVWDNWMTGELRISLPSVSPQTKNILKKHKLLEMDFALKKVKLPSEEEDNPIVQKLTNMEVALMCFP